MTHYRKGAVGELVYRLAPLTTKSVSELHPVSTGHRH
jgi:hypothetical protein